MSLSLYRIFVLTVKYNSFQKTAEELNYTPSAVSHAIARLEDQFGFKLFTRDKNSVIPTTYAKELLPRIVRVLEEEDKVQREVQRMRNQKKGLIKLGVIASLSASWGPRIVQRFHKEYPDVTVLLSEYRQKDINNHLLSDHFELAFVSSYAGGQFKSVVYTPLIKDPMLCVMAKDEYPENGKEVSIRELKDRTYILPNRLRHNVVEAFFREKDVSVYHKHLLNDDSAIISAVANGMGISILPKVVVSQYLGRVNAFPIECSPGREIGLVLPEAKPISMMVRNLVRVIQEFVQDTCSEDVILPP